MRDAANTGRSRWRRGAGWPGGAVAAVAWILAVSPVPAAAQAGVRVDPPQRPSQAQQLAAGDPSLDERVQHLTAELRCLVCQNQTIADSQAALAMQLKREVRQQLSQGASDQQVRDFMVQRYGDFVLYRPPLTGVTRWLWWGPVGLLGLGLAAAGWQWHRRRLGAAASTVAASPALDTRQALRSPAIPEALDASNAPNAPNALGAPRPWAALGWGAAVLAFTVALYAGVGTPQAWRGDASWPAQAAASPAGRAAPGPQALAQAQAGMTPAQIEAMVARLAQRLQAQPDDVAGWRMLVRSYETLGRYDAAVAAWRRLFALQPPDADQLTEFAVTLGMSQGQTLAGEPEQALQQALRQQPDHLQALALLGSAAIERGDHAQAIAHWRQILRHAPPDGDVRAGIEAQIAKAEALAATVRPRDAAPRRPPTSTAAAVLAPQATEAR